MDQMWKNTVDSSVNQTYVNPLYPKTGEEITISIQIGVDSGVSSVTLFPFHHGNEHPQGCYKEEQDQGQAQGESKNCIYSTKIHMPDEKLFWYFVLAAEDRSYYYSQKGITASPPSLYDSFSLQPDLVPVSWVGSSTCYQIFPDRFRIGDTSVGATDAQYSFDGGTVQTMDFSDKPLPFDEGKCLDFFNGDLKGIEDAIPHFKALGVNVLYLNPIGVSRTTHRYDCCDFFHIDEKLGGDEAFISLCKSLHENDMRIVVDISINHTGTEHPWLLKAQEDRGSEEASFYYFNEDGTVACWEDVPTLPQLNYNSPKLRELIYQSEDSVLIKFLKEPFGQDGWRLDVATVLGRRGEDQKCEEIWKEVRTAVKAENDQAYLVGEAWADAAPFLQGDMWDATMNYFGSSRPLRSWMGETDRFLNDGWGHSPKPTRGYTGVELAQALESQMASIPAQMLPMQMNLLDSHDTTRFHATPNGFDFDVYSGSVMLMYLLPGMPNLYYGDEVGLEGPYGSVEDSRYPMQWDNKEWDMRFYELYALMGDVRKRYQTMLQGSSYKILFADEQSLVFARYDRETAILCVLNKNEEPSTLQIPNSMLQVTEFLGGKRGDVSASKDTITIRLEGKENCIVECRRG
ncbi:MAG TPA: glycoside hydrolase family 13 protein [Sphaerochaeta sp.]|nr:glycoside hydrolase family 13 protein [Sphaerochaeta sp.]